MDLTNTSYSYGSVSKWIHWLTFAIILGLLIIGFVMVNLDDYQTLQDQLFFYHKSFGLLIIILALIRIIWTLSNQKPELKSLVRPWEYYTAKALIVFLYFLLFAMPISGWIMSTASNYTPSFFGLFTIAAPGIPHSKPLAKAFGEIHEFLAWCIIVVVSLHAGAALKHHFWDKDTILRRMLPNKKKGSM